jgi:hypothetical protein
MKRILMAVALSILLLGVVILAGCSDSTAPENTAPGRIKLNMIDAPGDYDEVNVHIVRIEVHRADADSTDDGKDDESGWSVISTDSMMVDLLTLTDGHGVSLADTLLPAGRYTQVRLILGGENTVVVGGIEYDLEIPSSMNTGIKLIHGFTIEPDALYQATLDFDADRSIHMTGNGQYKMKPVIRIIVDRISGGLEGTVLPAEARAMIWTVSGADTVTAWADTLTGAFGFVMLPEGSYDLNFSATAGAYRDSAVAGVGVTAGDVTDIGTVTLEAE